MGDTTVPTNVSRLRVVHLQDHGGSGSLQARLVAFGEVAQADPAAVLTWLLETVPEYGSA